MKNLFKTLLLLFAVATAAGCSDDNETPDVEGDELYRQIVENFVNTTVLPTYKSLAESALEMRVAVRALENNPTDATMKSAADAWMKARVAWEISEAYLFGPVGEDNLSIDPHIDSWPLELDDITKVLARIAAGQAADFDGAWAWDQEGEIIGFHVTEYLLYREGQPRHVNDLTAAERTYLTSATDALVWDCVMAYIAWAGENNVSAEIKAAFNENPNVVAHLKAMPSFMNYADKLINATNYPSIAASTQEIPTGCADIADEVGATKIEAPYAAGKTEDVESWYSWHSLDDYCNNIRSIQNAYLGGTGDADRTEISLSTYVARVNPSLDAEVKAKMTECITKIQAIGGGTKSFYEVVRDGSNAEGVAAAVTACTELKTLFDRVHDSIR